MSGGDHLRTSGAALVTATQKRLRVSAVGGAQPWERSEHLVWWQARGTSAHVVVDETLTPVGDVRFSAGNQLQISGSALIAFSWCGPGENAHVVSEINRRMA